MILQVYNEKKCKETFLSVKRKCPKELKFIFKNDNPCIDISSLNLSVNQWFNKFDIETKFYFINHIVDNPPIPNPCYYTKSNKNTSFNMDVFRSIYTSDKILIQIFEHCNDWKNNKFPKTKETITEEFLGHTLDYYNYSKEQWKQNFIDNFGFKQGDIIKTNKNTKFSIESFTDTSVELKNLKTNIIIPLGKDFLYHYCKISKK